MSCRCAEATDCMAVKGLFGISLCTGSILLTRHKPHGEEPISQRFPGAFKHGSRRDRNFTPTMSTVQIGSCRDPGFIFHTTTRASETRWPPKPHKILSATAFVRNLGIEFLKRTWVVNSGLWSVQVIHAHILYLVVTCVKWIPIF